MLLPVTHYSLPSELPRQVICEPMDEEWKERLSSTWWGVGSKVPFPSNWRNESAHRDVMAKCLSFGGEAVCMPSEDVDILDIIENGVFIYGDNADVFKMKTSRCHENAEALVNSNPDRYIAMTGYALSEDGVWRSHSWVIDKEHAKLVETTVPRVAYFGCVKTQ